MRPYHVLIFIACVMAALAVLCVVLPGRIAFGDRELRWPTLAKALGNSSQPSYGSDAILSLDTLAIIETADTVPPADTLPALQERTEERPLPPVAPKLSVDTISDTRLFLKAFYEALEGAATRKVRVMHYGDSQIEEDRLTQQIREALQTRYGGSGAGLLPLAQTIPSRTVRQELYMNDRFVTPMNGPKRYLVHGFRREQRTDGLYGPMGQMAVMNDSLVRGSEHIKAVCVPLHPNGHYDQWQVFADTSIHYTTSGDTVLLEGRGGVYALSQESRAGVIVDNIPLRGSIGTVFTKIDSTQLTTFYREQNVRLIILQFGGNAIPSNTNPGTIYSIVKGLRQQVRYLHRCAPEASILFIGPSDMLTQENGEWITYPMVSYMDRLLRKMALEENIGYFSLYQWMGGSGSMLRWQEVGLAGSDGVHFTRAGARKAGRAVADWILEGKDNF